MVAAARAGRAVKGDDPRERALREYHRRKMRRLMFRRDERLMTVDELLDAEQRGGASQQVPPPVSGEDADGDAR